MTSRERMFSLLVNTSIMVDENAGTCIRNFSFSHNKPNWVLWVFSVGVSSRMTLQPSTGETLEDMNNVNCHRDKTPFNQSIQ